MLDATAAASLHLAGPTGEVGDQQVLAGLERTVEQFAPLEAVALLGQHGEVLVTTEQGWPQVGACGLGEDASPRFARLVNTSEHELRVVVSVPVGPEDAHVGAICGRSSFDVHQRLLEARATSYVDGLVYVVDRKGVVVCGSFHGDEPHVHVGRGLEPALVALAQGGVAWTGDLALEEGEHIVSYAPAEGLPWGILVQVPTQRATAPLERLRSQAALFGLALTLALVGLVTLLARRLVRPVHALVEATTRIADGRYGEVVPIHRDDEVGRLATEFNRMSQALSASYERLDARVAERTRELEESRDFVDLILDSMEHRIVVLDQDLQVVRANEAARQRYGDCIGRHCSELLGCSSPCGSCPAREALRVGHPVSRESAAQRDEILAVECFPVPTHTGPASAVIQVLRDITEQKRLQAQAAHQEKMVALGQLAAGLAHEIGNPLASMSSELQLMELEGRSHDHSESLEVLRAQVERVTRLLRDLSELHGQSQVVEPVRMSEVVDQVLRLLKHDTRSRGVSLQRSVDPEAEVVGSRDALVQILLNLCINALDALAGRGSLEVSVACEPGTVVLRVSDDGPGVPEGLRERVLEPFFTTKPPGLGTGLGLFVTRRLVRDLGGTIQVGPSAAGGTCVEVGLPRWTGEHV